MWQKYIIQIF
jgi:hypothetical protein